MWGWDGAEGRISTSIEVLLAQKDRKKNKRERNCGRQRPDYKFLFFQLLFFDSRSLDLKIQQPHFSNGKTGDWDFQKKKLETGPIPVSFPQCMPASPVSVKPTKVWVSMQNPTQTHKHMFVGVNR